MFQTYRYRRLPRQEKIGVGQLVTTLPCSALTECEKAEGGHRPGYCVLHEIRLTQRVYLTGEIKLRATRRI